MRKYTLLLATILSSTPAWATSGTWEVDVLETQVVAPRGGQALATVVVTQTEYCTAVQPGEDEDNCPDSVTLGVPDGELPSGVTACFETAGGCSTTLNVSPGEGAGTLATLRFTVPSSASLVTRLVKVHGTGSNHETRVGATSLQIVDGYALSLSRTALRQVKFNTTDITIGRPAGDASTVALSLVSPPLSVGGQPCLTATFSPANTSGTTSRLHLSPTGACGPETYALNLRAQGSLGAVSTPLTFVSVF